MNDDGGWAGGIDRFVGAFAMMRCDSFKQRALITYVRSGYARPVLEVVCDQGSDFENSLLS